MELLLHPFGVDQPTMSLFAMLVVFTINSMRCIALSTCSSRASLVRGSVVVGLPWDSRTSSSPRTVLYIMARGLDLSVLKVVPALMRPPPRVAQSSALPDQAPLPHLTHQTPHLQLARLPVPSLSQHRQRQPRQPQAVPTSSPCAQTAGQHSPLSGGRMTPARFSATPVGCTTNCTMSIDLFR